MQECRFRVGEESAQPLTMVDGRARERKSPLMEYKSLSFMNFHYIRLHNLFFFLFFIVPNIGVQHSRTRTLGSLSFSSYLLFFFLGRGKAISLEQRLSSRTPLKCKSSHREEKSVGRIVGLFGKESLPPFSSGKRWRGLKLGRKKESRAEQAAAAAAAAEGGGHTGEMDG